MYGVAPKALSSSAPAALSPPVASPARRSVATGVPAYRAARPHAPTVNAPSPPAPTVSAPSPPAGLADTPTSAGLADTPTPGGLADTPTPGRPAWLSDPLPPLTFSRHRPELAGLAVSVIRSGTSRSTAAGKPRAAIAATGSTTRSIQSSWSTMSATGSLVSHHTGSAGPTLARTVSAIQQYEATTAHSARTVCSDSPTANCTNSSSWPLRQPQPSTP